MKTLLRALIILSSLSMLAACAPDTREQGSEVVTTYEPAQPNVIDEDGYKVVRGSTRVQDMSVNFDQATKGMTLKGKIEFLPVRAKAVQSVELDLAGILDPYGFIALKTYKAKTQDNQDLKVAAKATCLSVDGGCRSSFIDIYVYYQGIVYHHQVESLQDDVSPAAEEPIPGEEGLEGDEESEIEGGHDEVEGEPGRYVGDVADDIEKILEVKKPEQPKTEEPKKEEPATEEPVKEEPKKETPPATTPPKKEDPKKDPPKKDEPKKEDPKKDPPKKDEPKKEEPKKEEPPKREEPKKDPPKTGQPRVPETAPAVNKVSQAIGPVNAGRLQNAANMLTYQQAHAPTGYEIIRPKRKTHFATNELAYIIVKMGLLTKKEIPGYELSVGDLSREAGGKLGSHKSHQNGLDADVAFFFNNKSFQGYFASAVAVNKPHANWMLEPQWKLFKDVVGTQLIDRIFIHGTLKQALCSHAIANGELTKGDNSSLAAQTLRRLIPEKDHHNHFHLRVKCSKAQVRCRQMAEPVNTTGCF